MTSDRPFRAALPVTAALTELIRGAGSGFDPGVVGALLELAVERRLGINALDSSSGPSLVAVA
jgi:HD-GYP domain-containing protein (c-di-GMP phosphodiesterase class II)